MRNVCAWIRKIPKVSAPYIFRWIRKQTFTITFSATEICAEVLKIFSLLFVQIFRLKLGQRSWNMYLDPETCKHRLIISYFCSHWYYLSAKFRKAVEFTNPCVGLAMVKYISVSLLIGSLSQAIFHGRMYRQLTPRFNSMWKVTLGFKYDFKIFSNLTILFNWQQ